MKTQSLRNTLRAFMLDKKISQLELSKRTGVEQSAISRFLSGHGINCEAALTLLEELGIVTFPLKIRRSPPASRSGGLDAPEA